MSNYLLLNIFKIRIWDLQREALVKDSSEMEPGIRNT